MMTGHAGIQGTNGEGMMADGEADEWQQAKQKLKTLERCFFSQVD